MPLTDAMREDILEAAEKAYILVIGGRERQDYPIQVRVTQPTHEIAAILVNIVDTDE